MSLPIRRLFKPLLLLSFLSVCFLQTACVAADEENIFLRLGEFLGGAFRGEAPQPARVQAGEGAVPGEKELETYEKRIQAYSDVVQAWTIRTCEIPPDDEVRVQETFKAAVAASLQQFAKVKNPGPGQLPKTFILQFTRAKAPATEFAEKVFRDLRKQGLSAEQIQKLDLALEERKAFHRRAYISYLVSLFDKELFLTAEQRETITEQIAARKLAVIHPFYSFLPQSYYFPYEPLGELLPSGALTANWFEPRQQSRLADLTQSGSDNQNILFQSTDGIEGWYKTMNDMALKQREIYLRAAAVRVAWYQKEFRLTDDDVEMLTNATKGATVRALGDWKESLEHTFEQMQGHMAQAGGNFGFGGSLIDTRSIDTNEIWTDALKSLSVGTVNARFTEREAALKSSTAQSLLALFDEELWFSVEQRKQLTPLFEKSIPATDESIRHQEYIREVVLFAHPLLLTSEEERNKALTETQQTAWEILESFFTFQKQNNYVELQLQNNNGSFGFMLGR